MPSQSKSVAYIQSLISEHKLALSPGILLIGEGLPWKVFEHEDRYLGIDTNGVVWIGSYREKWDRLGECTLSVALLAVRFLVTGSQL